MYAFPHISLLGDTGAGAALPGNIDYSQYDLNNDQDLAALVYQIDSEDPNYFQDVLSLDWNAVWTGLCVTLFTYECIIGATINYLNDNPDVKQQLKNVLQSGIQALGVGISAYATIAQYLPYILLIAG